MLFVLLAHFGNEYFRGPETTRSRDLFNTVGMVATPTFVIISGTMLGYLSRVRQTDFDRFKSALMDRGLFYLIVGHLLTSAAYLRISGSLWRSVWGCYVTDVIGLCMAFGPALVRVAEPKLRVVIPGLGFCACWVAVLFWPATTELGLSVKAVLIGPRYDGVMGRFGYVFPILPWFFVYLASTAIGEKLGNIVKGGSLDEVSQFVKRLAFESLAFSLIVIAAWKAGKLTGLLSAEVAQSTIWLSIHQKTPPGPIYLTFFGGMGMAIFYGLIRWQMSPWLRPYVSLVGVLGRASFFVFMLQYWAYELLLYSLNVGYRLCGHCISPCRLSSSVGWRTCGIDTAPIVSFHSGVSGAQATLAEADWYLSSMTVSIVDSLADARLWDAYVSQAPDASPYLLYRWRRVITDTFGHSTFYLSAVADGSQVVGVLPLVHLKSVVFGNMLVSLPYVNYGGISATSGDVRKSLLDAAILRAKAVKVEFMELRHDVDLHRDLPRRTTKVSMRLDLPGHSEELWRSFPAKLRNQVQRPRKEGMRTVIGREDQLGSFYEVFSTNMRDLGTPVYPRLFFLNILRSSPETTHISTVYREDTPVASGFLVGFRDRLEIPWASSLRAFNKFSPNMLLYWSCLEFACQSGYRSFDFGRSTFGEGTYRFKEQWGAKAHPLFWCYWLRDEGEIPQVNPKNPKYELAIRVWRHLPVGLTRGIGPHIVKYIP